MRAYFADSRISLVCLVLQLFAASCQRRLGKGYSETVSPAALAERLAQLGWEALVVAASAVPGTPMSSYSLGSGHVLDSQAGGTSGCFVVRDKIRKAKLPGQAG